MPNTFSMATAYVRRYIADHHLQPPDVDVLSMLEERAGRFLADNVLATQGRAFLADVRDPPATIQREPARLIFTSPPYLQVIKYGKYNWIRLWFLRQDWRAV